jgi:hypothetical protein
VSSAAVLFNIWPGHQQGTELVTGRTIDFGYSSVAPVVLDNNVPVQVTLSYDGTTLTEVLTQGSDTYSTAYNVNVPGAVGANTAYVGFTGGAGGVVSDQFVSDFSFSSNGPAVAPTPAPPAVVLLLTGLLALCVGAGVRRLRAAQPFRQRPGCCEMR